MGEGKRWECETMFRICDCHAAKNPTCEQPWESHFQLLFRFSHLKKVNNNTFLTDMLWDLIKCFKTIPVIPDKRHLIKAKQPSCPLVLPRDASLVNVPPQHWPHLRLLWVDERNVRRGQKCFVSAAGTLERHGSGSCAPPSLFFRPRGASFLVQQDEALSLTKEIRPRSLLFHVVDKALQWPLAALLFLPTFL